MTKKQAENALAAARKDGKSLHDWLTVPPAAGGGDGPSDDIVKTFAHYIDALAKDDTVNAKRLLAELKRSGRAKAPAALGAKRRVEAQSADTHLLDAQLQGDIELAVRVAQSVSVCVRIF